MHRALILLLFAAACSGAGHAPRVPSAPSAPMVASGPDAILLRIPRGGGVVRAYRWGRDSALWTSSGRVPAIDHIIAFDDEQGALAYIDARGTPGRLDLRLGSATPEGALLTRAASVDGWAIYGLTTRHAVARLTPSGSWAIPAAVPPPRRLLPLPDGSLVLLTDDGERSRLARLHPPETRVLDTASVPHAEVIVATDLGDRIYFTGDSGLVGVRTRDLARTKTIHLRSRAADAVATPSGDRIFVALTGHREVAVVDRYDEKIERTIDLPGEAAALRMDPDGEYVLARATDGDSVYVIAVGTSRAIGTVRSAWRDDLPLVAPDGRLALVQDSDVVVVDAETRRERTRYLGGSTDAWTLIRWDGFRPRAAGLDQPVRFADDSADSAAASAASDSALASSVAAQAAAASSAARATEAATPPARAGTEARALPGAPPPRQGVFTLSFAALLSEARAKEMAATIRVDGHPVRVVPGTRDGTPIYRIVYGPFDSRDEADRAGRRTGLPYWVYEGAP